MENENVVKPTIPVSVPDSSATQPQSTSTIPQQESVQKPQGIPTPQTQSFNVESEPPKKRGSVFKKIIITILILVGLIIFLFVGGVLFSSRVLHKTPYIVLTPKDIPVGFERKETVQSEEDETGRFYIFTYLHPSKGNFTYHLQYNPPDYTKCSRPQTESSFISDYQEFLPEGSEDGCAMTLTDKDRNRKRVYRWYKDGAQFFVFAENLSVNEQEVKNIANSLKPELIFVGKYVDGDIPARDF